MSHYKKVLCGLDIHDDNLAQNVHPIISVAMGLTNNERQALHLAHVCDAPVSGYGEGIGNHRVSSEALIRQQVFPHLKQLLDTYELPVCHGHIVFGVTAESLHQLARDIGCDLIVIGNRERSFLARLLGSTTNHILQGAPCDILTVNIGD